MWSLKTREEKSTFKGLKGWPLLTSGLDTYLALRAHWSGFILLKCFSQKYTDRVLSQMFMIQRPDVLEVPSACDVRQNLSIPSFTEYGLCSLNSIEYLSELKMLNCE